MTIRKELTDDLEILKKDPEILFFWIFGVLLIFAGGTALNAANPNPQTGFPLIAIGFAFVIYGLNKFSSIESGKKIIDILTKIQGNLQDLKNRNHQGVNPIQTEKKQRNCYEMIIPYILKIVIFLLIIIIVIVLWKYGDPNFFNSQLFGVIIGAIIAFLSSYYILWKHEKNKLKTISTGFCVEFKVYKDWMTSWIADINKFNDTTLQSSTIRLDPNFPQINSPFFDSDSLYYSFRKGVFQFDETTAMKIFEFYSSIKGAEESRRALLNNFGKDWHPLTQKDKLLHIKTNFEKGLNLLSELERELGCL